MQIIKQIKHSIQTGGIQEMGLRVRSENRVTKKVHMWPSHSLGPLFKWLMFSLNWTVQKILIQRDKRSFPHYSIFSFFKIQFTNQMNGNIKCAVYLRMQEVPSSFLLQDLHCWHLSWFSLIWQNISTADSGFQYFSTVVFKFICHHYHGPSRQITQHNSIHLSGYPARTQC